MKRKRKTYEKFELAGLLAGLAGGFMPETMENRDMAALGLFALAAALTGAAAYLQLPAGEKEQIRFYLFLAASHVYLTAVLMAALLLLSITKLLYGKYKVLDVACMILLGIAAIYMAGLELYGKWYVWTDGENKRERREYHRKRHEKQKNKER